MALLFQRCSRLRVVTDSASGKGLREGGWERPSESQKSVSRQSSSRICMGHRHRIYLKYLTQEKRPSSVKKFDEGVRRQVPCLATASLFSLSSSANQTPSLSVSDILDIGPSVPNARRGRRGAPGRSYVCAEQQARVHSGGCSLQKVAFVFLTFASSFESLLLRRPHAADEY